MKEPGPAKNQLRIAEAFVEPSATTHAPTGIIFIDALSGRGS